MNAALSSSPVIRAMVRSDLDRIIAIDLKVLGKSRPEYWDMKLGAVEKHSRTSSLVAELDGRVVGFIIGGASRWEYGVPENVGWIDTIGVDPDYQGKGVAKLLFQEMTAGLKNVGVDALYTLVTRRDWKLLKFFNKLGFQKGDMTSLELDL
ncbi:MAG: GNAT family N-acetyltransferase [Pseudomonadota bacterium]